jgi:ABC-type transport system involved in multi-copper enzyme maturation permease subunit
MLGIAWITLRRVAEKAVLIQLGILTLVLLYIALGLQTIVLNDAAGAEQGGIFVTLTFLTAFTIFWTTLEIPREISRKEAQLYLSKPITRLQYLLGKFLGMAGMIVGSEMALLGIFAAVLFLKGQRPTAWFFFAAARTALLLAFLNAVCTTASIALSEIRAIVAVTIFLLVSGLMFMLPVLAWCTLDKGPFIAFASAYYIVPDLLHFRWEPATGQLLAFLTELLLYAVGWTILILALANVIIERRDLP